MTREQAEKLRAEKRRKRLRKKRIKAFTMLAVIVVVVVALAVFAVKGISYLLNGSPDSETTTDTSSGISVSDSISDGTEASSETTDVSSDSTVDESSQGEESADSNSGTTATVGEKPEQSWSTMLVNQWNYMPENYVPEVRAISYHGASPANNKFDVRAADALELMLADARAAGYNMYLVSAYRSHDYQVNLYNRKVNEYIGYGYDEEAAKAEASKWVAIPGTSEHCTGLAADIVSSTWYNYNSDLTHDFEDTEHFTWLYEHCADYGFILRYPKNREATTGITYEPWHYRYVGVDAAKYIMENNITLEEFHAQ